MADALDIHDRRRERGWSQARLAHELRRAAERTGRTLPGDETLVRQVRYWEQGNRVPSAFYVELLRSVFDLRREVVEVEAAGSLDSVIERATAVADDGLLAALEAHTQSLRVLDRRLGGRTLLAQAQAHADMIEDFLRWSPREPERRRLALAAAEVTALAGWQALDLGRPKQSWLLHRQARAFAREADDPSVIAHVTAQQAYALLDSGRVAQAVDQVEAARRTAGTRVSGLVQAWLAAVEAEVRAAAGQHAQVLSLLDEAEQHLETDEVPFLVLDSAHLARWRGHCLARLGDPEAEATLELALSELPPEFTRAAAALHVDLASTLAARGERDAARAHAQEAEKLADVTGSARQRARIAALLDPKGQQIEQRDERA